MNKWLSDFKASWRDKNFICAAVIFALSYLAIVAIAMLLPAQIVVTILGGIAGWQIASWSFRLAPKLKKIVFKD
jgi:hypothetical protein